MKIGGIESIIKNVTIIQKNGEKQLHDAILVTDKGIYTGSINRHKQGAQIFEEYGFIPRSQIERITAYNKQGKPRDIEL